MNILIFDKQYYTIKDLHLKITHHYNFKKEDLFTIDNILFWRVYLGIAKGITSGQRVRFSRKQAYLLLGFVHLHIYLGIKLSKLNFTKNYLIELIENNTGDYNKFLSHQLHLINLYEPNRNKTGR